MKLKSLLLALGAAAFAAAPFAASAALPAGFRELSYVESDGNQYIDTGIVPAKDVKVVVDYQFTKVSSGSALFGWEGGSGFLFGIVGSQLAATLTQNYVSGNTTVDEPAPDKDRHVLTFGDALQQLDETAIGSSAVEGELIGNLPGTIALFARHRTWNAGDPQYDWPCSARVYSCKIYRGETLVRDYVPCARRSDGVAGLFDQVTGRFSVSAGASPFLPVAWQELDYVESDGTAYVDTGVVAAETLKVVADFQLTEKPSGNVAVFGWLGNSALAFGASATKLRYAYMATDYKGFTDLTTVALDTERHVVTMANGAQTLDGQSIGTTAVTTAFATRAPGTLAVFARHYNWSETESSAGYDWKAKMRLYAFQVFDGETLVRDYVPGKRLSDGVAGLYERVSQSFVAAQGGTLAAGPVKEGEGEPASRAFVLEEVIKDGDAPAGARVSFGRSDAAARSLVIAYGRRDVGMAEDVVGERLARVCTVPAGTDEMTVDFPDAVKRYLASRTSGFRLYLVTGPESADGVPPEFAPVAYLESAGTEFLDTGVVAQREVRVIADFQLTEKPSASVAVFGWAGGCAHLFGANADFFRCAYMVSGYSSPTALSSAPDTERHVVSVRDGAQDLDYVRFSSNAADAAFATRVPGTIALFARHRNWSETDASSAAYDWYAKMRLYACQIHSAGTPVRDFVPCVRTSDGALGLYDRVGAAFYPISGTKAVAGARLATFEASDWVEGITRGSMMVIR